MRIVHLTEAYPPTFGGLELHVQHMAHALADRGHHASVVTMSVTGPARERDDDGIRVRAIQGWSRALRRSFESADRPYHPTIPDPGLARALGRVLDEERPDVVHAHGWILYSLLGMPSWRGAACIVTLHDYSLVCPKKTYLRRGVACSGPGWLKCPACASEQYGAGRALALSTGLRLSTHLHRRVDWFTADSTAIADASRRATQGVPIEVVSNFVPDSVLHQPPAARPGFLPPEDGFVLYAGALAPHKGLAVLLEAYERERWPEGLVLIGPRQRDMTTRLPNTAVVVGETSNADVLAAMDRASVVVVPSVFPEPFGLVALEGMARGLPVVASRTGGLVDIVEDGVTGLLVPPGNPDDLRCAVTRLLADHALRRRMGDAGRVRARRFAASQVIGGLERVYAAACEARNRVR